MGVLLHFEQNGKSYTLPLDFPELPFSHTGEALANKFQDTLNAYNVGKKVSTGV